MSVFDEYKALLWKMLEQDYIDEARKLVDGYKNTSFREDEEMVYLKAVLFYYEGEIEKARLTAEKGIGEFPESEVLYEILGILCEEVGYLEGASICYGKGDLSGTFDDTYVFSDAFMEERKRIVVFTGKIPILNYIARQFTDAYEEKGHTVLVLSSDRMDSELPKLLEFWKEGLNAAIVFNNSGFLLKIETGEVIWDFWRIPCYNILVDHPMYYFDSLDEAPCNGIVVCSDRNHVAYVKRFYPEVRRCLFLPTGGERLKTKLPYTKESYIKRKIDILFIGSNKYHYEVTEDAFFKKAYSYLLDHPERTVEEAVETLLQEEGKELSIMELKDAIQKYRFLDTNVNSWFRYLVIKSLVTAGIPVTVYGHGWESTDIFTHPCFLFQGTISPEMGIELMKDAKIVLNNMAWFKAGASERIFHAMLQGAVCLTDSSEYLKEIFHDGENIIYYSLKEIEKIPDLAKGILGNPDYAFSVAKAGELKALGTHEWSNRARRIL